MLSQGQQKDLEKAIWEYFKEKDYQKTSQQFQSESQFGNEIVNKGESENILQRKWLTIIKLQSKIVDLEQKLQDAQEILAKSVRRIQQNPSNNSETNNEDLIKIPCLKQGQSFKGHKEAINSVSIHPTEPVFASGSGDSTIRIYDYELNDQIIILKGHTHSVNSLAWEREVLISGSSDMSLKIWKSGNKTNEFNFAEFICHKTLIGHEHAVSYVYNIPSTEITVSCSRDKTIKFWDRTTTYCRRTISEYHEEWVRCCDSNDKFLVSSGNDKKVFVFPLDSLLNFDKSTMVDCQNCFEVHDNYVEAIKIFKEKGLGNIENVCVTASRDKTIGVWDFVHGTNLFTLTGHENWVKDIVIFEKFDFLISVGEDKTIRIWDLNKKKQMFIEKNAHDHFICSIDFNSEYRVLVSGSVDRKSKIWKIANSSSGDILNTFVN